MTSLTVHRTPLLLLSLLVSAASIPVQAGVSSLHVETVEPSPRGEGWTLVKLRNLSHWSVSAFSLEIVVAFSDGSTDRWLFARDLYYGAGRTAGPPGVPPVEGLLLPGHVHEVELPPTRSPVLDEVGELIELDVLAVVFDNGKVEGAPDEWQGILQDRLADQSVRRIWLERLEEILNQNTPLEELGLEFQRWKADLSRLDFDSSTASLVHRELSSRIDSVSVLLARDPVQGREALLGVFRGLREDFEQGARHSPALPFEIR